MQTFLPIATQNFSEVAKVLDNKRLNKQALEGWQIMLTLLELDPEGNYRKPKGWVNHPAVRMWRNHEPVLWQYVIAMTREWVARGYQSTIADKATKTLKVAFNKGLVSMPSFMPDWMINTDKYEEIASSHRSALLVKDYEWYKQFNWTEDTGVAPTYYEYVWK